MEDTTVWWPSGWL